MKLCLLFVSYFLSNTELNLDNNVITKPNLHKLWCKTFRKLISNDIPLSLGFESASISPTLMKWRDQFKLWRWWRSVVWRWPRCNYTIIASTAIVEQLCLGQKLTPKVSSRPRQEIKGLNKVRGGVGSRRSPPVWSLFREGSNFHGRASHECRVCLK